MDIPKGKFKADLIYKNTPQRDLMLTFLPPIKGKFESAPVYFIITGGGWHVESRESILGFSADSVEALRNEGFAVVSIDYRVCPENVVMREIIADCFDAARYIAHYADILEVDKNRFMLSGHSAGAHLALMLAYAPKECFEDGYELDGEFTVGAVAAMSPPTVLYDNQTHNLGDLQDAFKNCDTEEERKKTSPIEYISDKCPPTLLVAGTSDYVVFANSSEKLYEKLQQAKAKSKIVLSLGGGHCFEKIHADIEPSVPMEKVQKMITEFMLQNMD